PLYLANRSGNRPSHEGAATYLDRAVALCRRAGFKRILLRGDTDFSQTAHLDRWDAGGVQFVFGLDAMRNLVDKAENLPKSAWQKLRRPAKYTVKTQPRQRPANVKERIVVAKGYKNIKLAGEAVAAFAYRPTACRKTYTVVALRKELAVEQGQLRLFDDVRYFFYLTNLSDATAAEVVYQANARCNQENLLEQLRNGVQALRMPLDNLVSNWAYLVMAALAWSLKAWFTLLLPERGRWKEKYRAEKRRVLTMEFKRFVNAFIRVPCQIVRTGRRIIYRLLAWNPWQHVFLRGADALRRAAFATPALRSPLRC
ncbi:MAG: transposase, partial [Phycisphaerae bacterium]